jgi:histidine ammonia-lyase
MVSENTSRVIAIELMCAAQAIDLMPRRRLGAGTEKVYRFIREHVPPLTVDRPPSSDIETLAKLVLDGSIANCFS